MTGAERRNLGTWSRVYMCAFFVGTILEPEPRHVVGPSVPTDLRCVALAPCLVLSGGKTIMQKILGSFALALVAASIVAVGSAHAQPAAQKQAADKGGTPKVKVYDFSGDTIEGDLIRPEGTTVDARDFAKHSSLIRIRKDFIPEIIKSAEDL